MHKNENAPPETISPRCDLYGQQKQFGVHVIKATQNTRLKATPKNTGKKATKIYRNIGYNEYTGSKATAFLKTQEKRLHFLNIQEKGYTFGIYKKKATFFEYCI